MKVLDGPGSMRDINLELYLDQDVVDKYIVEPQAITNLIHVAACEAEDEQSIVH